jgi:hypothetical protein
MNKTHARTAPVILASIASRHGLQPATELSPEPRA